MQFKKLSAFFILMGILLAGCTGVSKTNETNTVSADNLEFVGSWKIYSPNPQAGGASGFVPSTRMLEIKRDGTWEFGNSTGTWEIQNIQANDWSKWLVEDYGPTQKIVFNEWNETGADGPIERSTRLDFFWIIYQVGPPVFETEKQLQMKFGRPDP
ncbi:MAG: hypothetical protein Q7S92_01990 [Candidatus Diapherotrites archaeon]|nr:hypothetical protein [Candidatus Diapherotrites archaeon]